MFKKGDFVTINKEIGVVVMTGEEIPGDSCDHTGVWFGTYDKGFPEVWIIPSEYLKHGPESVLKH
ncbi:MAG: hypothetical protein FJ271_08225 [Planctomycetes bacterium]|nr:hypothetical protein [Planctomycetota bacterium]